MISYTRFNGGGGSFEKPVINATDFNIGKVDFGFNASHIKIEVVGVGTAIVGFGEGETHAQLDNVNNGPGNPAIFENIGYSKIFIKGSSADVKVTAWNDGRK